MREFLVASVSKTTNSFGLRGMVMVAKTGEAWEVGGNHLQVDAHKKGSTISVPTKKSPLPPAIGLNPLTDWPAAGFEIPHRLTDAPKGVLKELFG